MDHCHLPFWPWQRVFGGRASGISCLSPIVRSPDTLFTIKIALLIFLPERRLVPLTSFHSLIRPSLSLGSSSLISLRKRLYRSLAHVFDRLGTSTADRVFVLLEVSGRASPPRVLRTSPFSSRFRLAFAIVGLTADLTKSQLTTVSPGLKGKTRHCDSRLVKLRHAWPFYEWEWKVVTTSPTKTWRSCSATRV
jgi:hypothetical protein